MDKKELICIVCPVGCHLEVVEDNNIIKGFIVSGNQCKRGEEYAIKEMANPTRVLTTTVKIRSDHLSRLPVKTSQPIPKDKIFECMKEINRIEVKAPIKVGDIVIKNILGTGADVIATREM